MSNLLDENGFFPLNPLNLVNKESKEREIVLDRIRQSPRNFGLARSRWTLQLLKSTCSVLSGLQTLSGVWRRLRTWRIRLKQGRLHLHSPDPEYATKAKQVQACLSCLHDLSDPDPSITVLFGDEMTFYRCPTPARTYAEPGKEATYRADLGHKSNTKRRLSGALNARTGQVHWMGASRIGVSALCKGLRALRSAYPLAVTKRLILIWDNWPVHKHEKVIATALEVGIELVWLPTYAPWLNPIEKLWRKLKQEVLSLHRCGDDWSLLQEQVNMFLDQFKEPDDVSKSLLAYVGLGNKILQD